MRQLLIILFVFVFVRFQKAQPLSVSAPTIIALNNWSVKIKTKVEYSANASTLGHSFMKDFTNKTLTLTSCYYGPGILTVMTTIRDSVEIGFLPTGDYTLHYTVYSSMGVEGCNPYDTVYNTYSFHVGPTNINELEMLEKLQLVPNPIKDNFMIKGIDQEYQIEKIIIYNCLGQALIEYPQPDLNTNMALEAPPGVYFIEIKNDVLTRKIRFIKE
jgi:hypothetical protein